MIDEVTQRLIKVNISQQGKLQHMKPYVLIQVRIKPYQREDGWVRSKKEFLLAMRSLGLGVEIS
jgi:hypothetical protein